MQRAIKELYVTRDDKHSIIIKTRPPLARLSVSKVFWGAPSETRRRSYLEQIFYEYHGLGRAPSTVRRAR